MIRQLKPVLETIGKKRKLLVVLFLGLLVVGMIASRVLSKDTKPNYQTTKVEQGTIIASISASGQILTTNIINITTSAKGLVKKVYVKDGDKVVSGQKILEITLDSDGQQKAASAYSAYFAAKNSFESSQITLYTLDSQMWASNKKFMDDAVFRSLPIEDPTYIQEKDDWLAAEAKYKNQQAVISQAKNAVNNAWIAYQAVSPIVTTPISGTISNLSYAEGMTLSGSSDTGQRIAVIRFLGTPLASFNVSEIDVVRAKTEQKATIKIDSIQDKTFTGKVVSVDRIGTVASNVTNYPVIIRFDVEASDILPNMSATANIILEAKDNVLLVPSAAVIKQGDQNVVRILKNGKEQIVSVETGLTSNSQTEIVSGLSVNDEVITSVVSSNQSGGGSVFGGGSRNSGRQMFMGR